MELIDRETLLLDVRGMNDGWRDPKPAYDVETLIKDQPTIAAVPLDKLCDWLAAVADGDPSICMECAGNKGGGEWECPDEGEACKDSEVWKRHIRAWMQKESLNATD